MHVVTISATYGAGGALVGPEVAERLGVPFVDRAIPVAVADDLQMSIDDALSRMELVGHDFYLFSDTETGAPSVVYRRKGYDYGVIRLSH